MESLLSVCLGLGLAAACGFRVFVPFLLMSVAARLGYLELAGNFEWIGGVSALVTFSVATALEIGAYYVPWLDNLLDSVATPAAVVAGVVVTASVVSGIDPYLKWVLAVIAGGGVAAAVQTATVGVRQASLLGTGGVGNPIVSSAEAGMSLGMGLLALALPLLALFLLSLVLVVAVRLIRRRRPA